MPYWQCCMGMMFRTDDNWVRKEYVYLPPLVYGKPAVAIIISPLIGLMEEQVCL